MVRVFLALALAISLFFNAFLLSGNREEGNLVIGAIDGDTVVMADNKTRVRLRYVDAPETGLCGSKEASDLLASLTVGKKVVIQGVIPDQYGRGMAMIYVGDKLVNKEMMVSGWVRYHADETPEKEEIKKASEEAKALGLGVYGKCEATTPKDSKCVIKGNIDFVEGNRKTYHLPGCRQYKTAIIREDLGEAWFCTEAEARKAGFIRAKTCR